MYNRKLIFLFKMLINKKKSTRAASHLSSNNHTYFNKFTLSYFLRPVRTAASPVPPRRLWWGGWRWPITPVWCAPCSTPPTTPSSSWSNPTPSWSRRSRSSPPRPRSVRQGSSGGHPGVTQGSPRGQCRKRPPFCVSVHRGRHLTWYFRIGKSLECLQLISTSQG